MECALPTIGKSTVRKVAEELANFRMARDLEHRLKAENPLVREALIAHGTLSVRPQIDLLLGCISYRMLELKAADMGGALPRIGRRSKNAALHGVWQTATYRQEVVERAVKASPSFGEYLANFIQLEPMVRETKLSSVALVYGMLERELLCREPEGSEVLYQRPFGETDRYKFIRSCISTGEHPAEMTHMHSVFFSTDVPIVSAREGQVMATYAPPSHTNIRWDDAHTTRAVLIDHGDGTVGQYTHVLPVVEPGQRVGVGTALGTLEGYAFGDPHLHFGVWEQERKRRKSTHVDFADDGVLYSTALFERLLSTTQVVKELPKP